MNNTAARLREAAWSKINALSSMRQFIQNELEHSQSFLPTDSIEKLRRALGQIDSFNAEVFELIQQTKEDDYTENLEQQIDELSDQYDYLMEDVGGIFGE